MLIRRFVILSVTIFSSLTFADVRERDVQAAEVAVWLIFAKFPNPECVLTNDMDGNHPEQKVTFTLHTAQGDANLTLEPSDKLHYSVDETTGDQQLTSEHFEMSVSSWTGIRKITINAVSCQP